MKQPRQPSIERVIELQRLLLLFTQVQRQCLRHEADGYQYENDTEHSYNLAMTAWFLAPQFPELDLNRLIKVALAHDIVEVYAGDTFAYADPAELAQKPIREAAALKRLKTEWADFPELLEAIEAYEDKQTAEVLFVYALDKLMPAMLTFISDGRTWREKNISLRQIIDNKRAKVSLSPEIEPYFEALCELLHAHPDMFPAE